jgi:CubicO group peptidase (beta-lactamase class C family)
LGLGAGDLLWWPPSDYDRKEIVRRLRFIPPAKSFRSAYAYDNVLYLVASEIVEAVTHQSWDDFVRTRIIDRVGMKGTRVGFSGLSALPDVAAPHAPVQGGVRSIQPMAIDTVNPAGGINSNAEDMAKWVMVQLRKGVLPDGSRLFSDRTSGELTTPVTPMPFNDPPPEFAALAHGFQGYALGLIAQDYRGHKMLTHTGGMPGYVSRVLMIPDINLGVVVLTNQESGEAFNTIIDHVADHYLKATSPDWRGLFEKIARNRQQAIQAAEKNVSIRISSAPPPLPLTSYAGTYTDSWYGDIIIELAQGRLVMRFSHTPSLAGDLEHYQFDTFIVRWKDRELRADAYVTFGLNPDGTIDQVKMRPVSPATDFSFDFQDLLLRPTKRK